MTHQEREEFKKKIQESIVKMEMEVARLEESTLPISPENSIGRVSRMDAINNKGVLEASLRSSKRKLSSLRLALTKIDNPDFGICSRCRRPIQAARLLFMPESALCVHCAERHS
jgi:DnaK suppressor protein